jgi:hypothetical protein
VRLACLSTCAPFSAKDLDTRRTAVVRYAPLRWGSNRRSRTTTKQQEGRLAGGGGPTRMASVTGLLGWVVVFFSDSGATASSSMMVGIYWLEEGTDGLFFSFNKRRCAREPLQPIRNQTSFLGGNNLHFLLLHGHIHRLYTGHGKRYDGTRPPNRQTCITDRLRTIRFDSNATMMR